MLTSCNGMLRSFTHLLAGNPCSQPIRAQEERRSMRVIPVPVNSDNYAYLLVDKSGVTAAVDPCEPQKLIKAAEKEGLKISKVLTTHHHWDHAGGNEEIAKLIPGIEIVGGEHDHVSAATTEVADKEEISVGSISIKCLETPFHTLGHICYLCSEAGSSERIIFTGDTLFIGGCGRCFAGTPQQMYSSLIGTLSKLPPDIKVMCGHEYTVKNLEFAAAAESSNKAVSDKLEWARAQRAKGLPTIPSTIGDELTYNPFLRCGEPDLAKWCGMPGGDPVAVLAELRRRKDNFGLSAAEELSYNPFLRISQPDIMAYCGGSPDQVQVLASLRKKKDGF